MSFDISTTNNTHMDIHMCVLPCGTMTYTSFFPFGGVTLVLISTEFDKSFVQ